MANIKQILNRASLEGNYEGFVRVLGTEFGTRDFGTMLDEVVRRVATDCFLRPCAKDGTPIELGSDWYGKDGTLWRVEGYREEPYNISARNLSLGFPYSEVKELKSKWLTKEPPDSFQRVITDAIALGTQKSRPPMQSEFEALIQRCEAIAKG